MLLSLLACINSAPSVTQIGITPELPRTDDDLAVALLGETGDPDGDEVELRYAWSVDGELREGLVDAWVSASETKKGETWSVEVTPTDGEADGSARVDSVVIANTPPTILLELSPAEPTAADEIHVDAVTTDADEDPVTVTWTWTRDGAPTETDGGTLPAGAVTRGEEWSVTAVASDGEEEAPAATLTFGVGNALPYLGSATLYPDTLTVGSRIYAKFDGAGDADADPVTLHVSWQVDGVEVATEDIDPAGIASIAGLYARGQSVVAVVTPNDGLADGAAVTSNAVEIGDSAPSLTGAQLLPDPIVVGEEVRCEGIGWADADGDPPAWRTAWTIDGVAAGAEATLAPGEWGSGDTIGCTLTPDDGELNGIAVHVEGIVP